MPSNKCEGGFSLQFAAQTVIRPCVKPSTGPSISSLSQVTHFDAPVSRFVFSKQRVYPHFFMLTLKEYIRCCIFFFFQGERLVLILVCAGAGVIVLIAIASAILAVRRVVYRNRWARHTFLLHVHFTHTVGADRCGFLSPSTGHPCIVSQTSRFRRMTMALHLTSKAALAAIAQPASQTQMM